MKQQIGVEIDEKKKRRLHIIVALKWESLVGRVWVLRDSYRAIR